MNEVVQLRGRFTQVASKGRPGPPNIPKNQKVCVSKLIKLKNELVKLQEFWKEQDLLPGALVSVYYIKIVAKSNRIKRILRGKGKKTSNSSVVGARFTKDKKIKHIITHYVSLKILDNSIDSLNKTIEILNEKFQSEINHEKLKKIDKNDFDKSIMSASTFREIIVDAYYVEKFDIYKTETETLTSSIVNIYKTELSTIDLMEKLGITMGINRVLDKTTLLLYEKELEILKLKAPYLISMASNDLNRFTKEDFNFPNKTVRTIPAPSNEPTIGVIDTLFDKGVYFEKWVCSKKMIDEEVEVSSSDYNHGTAISSIIVDGPSLNPDLDDGCGRFKVKHFGVAAGKGFNSFSILKSISEIISSNKDIKVWNLSLGSKLEINQNFISPEAAILDKLQYENDIIFVVAGTNKSPEEKGRKFIGSPADSINSLVVNSVTSENKPQSYTRNGPVLSFFTKPDISYYGDANVCIPGGEKLVSGTSYAAPWIARKLSYLIDILGLSREVAKALIITSSTSWEKEIISPSLIGHGIVPIKIEDLISSPEDEIKFILQGTSEKYDTFNHHIPVPTINQKKEHPFIAKATLCYFPKCSRNQGIDYTSTELDISFGRINKKDGIKPINNNYQTSDVEHKILEEDARKLYRKWDNIKHIREIFNGKNRAKAAYQNDGRWGISLKTKERLEEKSGEGLKFGIVISLKEIKGINRIDEFIKLCSVRGWFVNKLEVKNKIEIYNKSHEEITFD